MTTHDNSFKFLNIPTNSKIVIPTAIVKNLDHTTVCRIHMQSSVDLIDTDLTVSFSEDPHGEIVLDTFNFSFEDVKSGGKVHSFEFFIEKKAKERYNLIKNLSNVNAVVINVNKAIPELYICDISIKNDGYNNTIEDVEAEYETGRNHILSRLPNSIFIDREIPPQLQHLTYMAAAGYLITKRLQNEFKKSDSGHISSKNHGRWLLQQVDAAINAYLEDIKNGTNEYTVNYTWLDLEDAWRDKL